MVLATCSSPLATPSLSRELWKLAQREDEAGQAPSSQLRVEALRAAWSRPSVFKQNACLPPRALVRQLSKELLEQVEHLWVVAVEGLVVACDSQYHQQSGAPE